MSKDELITGKSLELEQLIKINEKLGKLIELGVDKRGFLSDICVLKVSQQKSDNGKHLFNTVLSLIGIAIAVKAIHIANADFFMDLYNIFK